MEFGITVATATDSWKVVKRAEELGFSHAWFYDTQLLCADVYAVMALAAHHTSRIKLGTGVAIPSNRLAPVVASALATINHLAPGRVLFGVGTGFTARRTMGMNAVTLKELERYVHEVYGLLKGGIVETQIEGETRKIRLLNPEAGLINTRDPVPLHLSAMGPRARQLCAKLGAGWLNVVGDVDAGKADLVNMREAWAQAGRDSAALHNTAFAIGRVLEDGEPYDSPKAIAQAGPMAAVVFHNLAEAEERGSILPADPSFEPTVARYRELMRGYEPSDARYLGLHEGHLIFVRKDERHLITGDWIRRLTFTGTADALRERIVALRDAGYDQLTVQMMQGQEDAIEDWAKVVQGL